MSFFVSQKTLERLEWNRILAMMDAMVCEHQLR